MPVATTGHTDANQAANFIVGVSVVAPQPVLGGYASNLCTNVIWKRYLLGDTVEHGCIPFVVARHPAEVEVLGILVAKEFRVWGSVTCVVIVD